eukprot:4101415-Pleurochrysis_carterae.AAC.1
MSLLETEAGEAERRLAAAAVLLRQIDGELVQDLTRVARQRAIETAIAVHHDESELVVRLEQFRQCLHTHTHHERGSEHAPALIRDTA